MYKLSENLLQNAVDLNETVVFEYDLRTDLVRFSDNLAKYIPMPQQLSGFVAMLDSHGKVHPDDLRSAITFFSSPKSAGKVRMEYVRFIDLSGDYRWYQLKGRTEVDQDGVPVSLFGTLTYIDDATKKRQEEEAQDRDDLTHLLVETSFRDQLFKYLETIPKDAIPNMMIVDIDDFEEWTETHGRVSGDGAAMEVARILKRAFRNSDLIGRIKNDRFVVSMRGVRSINILLERAAYVCQQVRELFKDVENSGGLTVSIGIAALNRDQATPVSLNDRALAALMDAMRSGKDTYVLYTGDSERMDTSVNPILSTKEMELVKELMDPMYSWAYAVDEDYQLLYRNAILQERLGHATSGICYKLNKGYSQPCPDCPIRNMEDKESSLDCEIYSTSLRTSVPTRITKVLLRNGKYIYIVASVKENTDSQLEELNESDHRIRESLYRMNSLVWDVNLVQNSVVRMKEDNMYSVMDMRIENFRKIREFYIGNVVHPHDINAFNEAVDPKYLKQAFRVRATEICREVRFKDMTGEYKWYSIYTSLLYDNYDTPEREMRVIIVGQRIHEYKLQSIAEIETKIKYEVMKQKSEVMQEMSLNFERHENVNEMIGILVYEYYVDTDTYYLCSTFDEIFDVDRDHVSGTWGLFESLRCHPDDARKFEQFIETIKTTQQTQKTTVRLYNKYDTPIWYSIYVQPLRGLNNQPVRYLGTFQNVNTEMEIKAEMEYRADFDSMTGLYNSEAFYRKANEMIHLNEDVSFAMLSIDIERFRIINDKFGIEVGNRVLAYLGKAIHNYLPMNSIAKRYQGDVFTVLLAYESEQDILDFINALTIKMRENDILPQTISVMFGIYKIVDRSLPIRLMCDRAHTVKRQTKGSIYTNYAVYDDVIRLKMREQAEIEQEMEMALYHNEFAMYLQPQINLENGQLCGAEALVRWEHPIKGTMVPAQFLPLFESNGFITRLDRFMWEEACKYLVSLRERGIDIPISVNISRAHIGQTSLIDTLEALVKKYNIPPEKLELEITENLFMDDVEELFSQMDQLKEKGFRILMDDFGSGYSSLNMLRKASVDVLKIDRFFLDEIMMTSRGKIIVEASVRMAKQLGLLVIAEGVETEEQRDFLKNCGCDIVQGFLYSRPISIQDFEEFMNSHLTTEK